MTAVYNYKKREEQILARFAKSPPSFAVHLYSGHWTLNKDNNARTFLYNSPAVSILDSIRAHQVPVDMLEMLDQANIPFYDGCLIVEEHDHTLATGETTPSDPSSSDPKAKAQSNSAQKRKIVLYPNGETLWADISILNTRNGSTWSDQQAIEFEAKILSAIAPPLCLDPDPIASKIASLAMNSASLHSPKRKHSSMENDKRDDSARKAEHDKFMNVMNPRSTRIFHPDFRQISWVEEYRRGTGSEERPGSPAQGPAAQAPVAPTPTPPPSLAPGLPELIDEQSSSQKKKSKKKRDGPDSPMQVDAPSPGLNPANPRKNSITQITPLPISGGKKKQNRRGTASSVEPSPANLVVQLPHAINGQVSATDSPQSVQASPNPAMMKKDEMQSTLASKIASLAMNSTSLDSPKRKHSSMENDKRDDTARKAEHDKFMNVMNPRSTRIFHPDFRQISWVEEYRQGSRSEERPGSPAQGSGVQAPVAPTPTPPPPGSIPGLPESIDEQSSSQKKKSKKKRDGPDSPMQVDIPSPSSNSAKPRKNSITQITPLPIGGSKKKQGQQNRRGTASSVEPSPANLVVQLPHAANGQVSATDSPQSVQASPNPAMIKKDEMQSTLGIGIPPPTSHSPAPTGQQMVSGPPKKRMKTETPSIGNVPLPGAGSQHGTPQPSYIPLNPHLGGPGQQPNPTQPGIHRYSASPAPTPTAANNQPTHQYPGQLAHNYGPLGLNIANGMMFNNGTGAPGYNAVPGMQQPQMPNMHANMFAAQNQQQQAPNQATSPHPHPPSRPASQASVPMRNSPHPPQATALGGNTAPNLQVPQQSDQVRPTSGLGQHGVQMNAGMHQAGAQMQMPVDQMLMFRQMQAQRMAYPGTQNMMQYPGFPMQMAGQPWQMGQLPMGVGRGQPLQQQQFAAATAMQRRGAMQAPPNPQR
ncbi:unnamed protein product [Rhizoctonia solani]|uniref:Spt20-like SEP domain-containing protein n=1 Tax=Rhizoctonia solani TaxID=456999 RepID=A0A8H3B4I9_9AGAM|nr:unnamed protein product [Rhizoctonia solani]